MPAESDDIRLIKEFVMAADSADFGAVPDLDKVYGALIRQQPETFRQDLIRRFRNTAHSIAYGWKTNG